MLKNLLFDQRLPVLLLLLVELFLHSEFIIIVYFVHFQVLELLHHSLPVNQQYSVEQVLPIFHNVVHKL